MNSSADRRPDVDSVLGGLKDFQRLTVDHVFERLFDPDDPSMRFLVADEVGLGKTLVARGVVAKTAEYLWDKVDRIDVVYICSNGDIARQNLDRLNIGGENDAVLSSRLTLLAKELEAFKSKKLHFISFTPGTSFEKHKGMGRAEERVLLYWLLRSPWRLGNGAAPKNVLQGFSSARNFRWELGAFDPRSIDPVIRRSFRDQLAVHEREARASGRQTLRRRFRELCAEMPRDRPNIPEGTRGRRAELVSDLRAVLAAACVTALEPDLVILDEFQRFRYLLDPNDEASKLAHELFDYSRTHEEGTFHERCRTLLLSATPYKMYTMAGEAGDEDHYKDFLDTAGFLFDSEASRLQLEELLSSLRREMLRLDDASRDRVVELRRRIEDLLRRVMVRTERLAVTSDRNGMLRTVSGATPALEQSDIRAYLGLQGVAAELEHPDIVEHWKSSPYVLNFMDDYKLKRDFAKAVDAQTLEGRGVGNAGLLDWSGLDRYKKLDAGNSRLRKLSDEMIETKAWRLLWLPPSLPYYELSGPFAEPAVAGLTKRLVFSAWHVVPKAIAGILSYSAEREMMCSRGGRPANTPEARAKRARLLEFSRRKGRLAGMPVVGLMYPSPTLAREIDPLLLARQVTNSADARGVILPKRSEILALARKQVRELLRPITAGYESTGEEDEAWFWAAPMLIDLAFDPDGTSEWFADPWLAARWAGRFARSGRGDEASGFEEHVARARSLVDGTLNLGRPPADLDAVVAEFSLGAPATCLLRAFGRIADDPDEIGMEWARDAAGSTAFAFRRLFNAPEVIALVRGKRDAVYWRLVLAYSIDGGFQSMIDEYAHVLVESLGLIGKPSEVRVARVAAEMERSVGVQPSRLRVDDIDLTRSAEGVIKRRELRTRFAARFGVEENPEEGTEPTRSDTIRSAFNSPFWPFVLASTSVGQEGLDFHLYCHAVVHWNLPSNPVDLEQREGRIHRYKGHAVRKNLATVHGARAMEADIVDPWTEMFDWACDARAETESDLVPYWVYPVDNGACIERHLPTLPLSREATRVGGLLRSLAVYRMVFGQPRQDDLVELLLSQLEEGQKAEKLALLDEMRIDLSPSQVAIRGRTSCGA